MSWLTKILGIDAARNAQKAADQAATQAAQDRQAALDQQARTDAQTKQYQASLVEQARQAQQLQAANDALVTPEITSVIAGGSATQSYEANQVRRKRSTTPSIASTLGLNL